MANNYKAGLKAACQKMEGKDSAPDKDAELEEHIASYVQSYSEYGVQVDFDGKAGVVKITAPKSAVPKGQEGRIHKHELKVADYDPAEFGKALVNEIDHLEDELYCAAQLANSGG